MTKKSLYILLLLTCISLSAFSQPYVSKLGRFQVDQKKGCAPLSITLTNLLNPGVECQPGKPCNMDYETPSVQQQNTFTHTYLNPGTYTLQVNYQSIGVDTIKITVVANTQPNFEIYACSGDQARIRVFDNKYDQYIIDFNNDGTPESILPFSNNIITPSYTFSPPSPPVYTTSVRGRNIKSADNCTAKTQPFTSMSSLPVPTINTLTAVDNANIKLDFTSAINVLYRLEVALNNSTTFQLLQTAYGVNTVTIPNLNQPLNYYCFRLSAFDPCSGSNTYSNIVCSSKFTATAQSDVNQLAWTTSNIPFVVSYAITRNGNPYFTVSNPAATTFSDNGIVCKTDYCYQMTTNYTGGSKSISLSSCVKSFSTKIPTAITDVSAVVGNGVDLNWTQDPAFVAVGYIVNRSSNGSAFQFYAQAPTIKFNDNVYTTEGKYCYRIGYIDKCDNASPQGITTCPVRLTGTMDKNNVITLVWSSYKGWTNGVKTYVLEKYNIQGSLIKTVNLTDTTFVDDVADLSNQLVRYVVKVMPIDILLTTSVSNQVEFIKDANLYYPTAFTPNSDNLNDGFTVTGQYIVKMSLKVFDRWGNLLFATEKNEPWDGQREGKPMPASTYVWKAEISDLAGRTFSREGTVALIRN